MDSGPPNTSRALTVALFAMLGSSALVAGTSLLAKTLALPDGPAPGLNPFLVSSGRFAFALLALLVMISSVPSLRPQFTSVNWRRHFLRSSCGWLGITCMFAAVANMPVAEATAISFLSPVVTVGLSAILLSERIGPRKIAAGLLSLSGAALILRPGTDAFQSAGLFALAAAFLMGLEAIIIKKLSGSEPAAQVLVINNTIGATISLSVASFVWIWPTAWQWGLLAALGVVMVSAQALFFQALKRSEASAVITVFYTVLVFSALYDLVLYGVEPAPLAIWGAALIVSAALLLARVNGRD